jgi:hypothetical protein
MQPCRVCIETAEPQCRDRHIFGGQLSDFFAQSPLKLEVLDLDPSDSSGDVGDDLLRLPDFALQPCDSSGRPRGESPGKPERQSARQHAAAGATPY